MPLTWMRVKVWIDAFRAPTLLLSFSVVSMGAFLSIPAGAFRWQVYALAILTAFFLQILSNLANDYGDHVHGADRAKRVGPARATQSGAITQKSMKASVIVLACLCLISGISLLGVALHLMWEILLFLLLGVLSIFASVTYTMGKKPYGYRGLGDLFVFIFFGPVGVLGSAYLFTQQLFWSYLLPATSCGVLSVAVLNINNIRDIKSDMRAGKNSVPVRIGRKKATLYHWALLSIAVFSALAYTALNYQSSVQLLFLVLIPSFVIHGVLVARKPLHELHAMLKQMLLIVLVFVLCFGIGIVMGKN